MVIVQTRANPLENPQVTLSQAMQLAGWSGGTSTSGISVNAESILTYHPIWRGLRLISGDVMRTPLDVYKRTPDGREKAKSHPAYYLLKKKANPEMTAETMKRVMMCQAILYGDAFAYITRLGNGKPTGIIPLDSSETHALRANGVLQYATLTPAGMVRLPADDVLHIRDIGDGHKGHGLLEKAKNSLGIGMAAERYSGKFFANGATINVVIEYPNKLTPTAIENLRETFRGTHSGVDNAHKAAILDNGAKLSTLPMTMKNTDAQLIDSRKFELVAAANWLSLPPHKLGDSTRTGYNSIWAENQSYLDECLDHWLVTFESECNAKLLTEAENRNDTHYCEFNREALLQADPAVKAEVFSKALGGQPWMTPDEVRARVNMNNLPDGEGGVYRPSANITGGAAPDTTETDNAPPEPAEGQNSADLSGAHRRLLLDALKRMAKRLALTAKRDSKRDLSIWAAELEQKHGEIVRETLDPVLEIVAPGALNRTIERLFEAVRTRIERLNTVPEHQKERLCGMEMDEFMADWPLRETDRILQEAE